MIEIIVKRMITKVFITSKTTNLSNMVSTKNTFVKAIKISANTIRDIICHIVIKQKTGKTLKIYSVINFTHFSKLPAICLTLGFLSLTQSQ